MMGSDFVLDECLLWLMTSQVKMDKVIILESLQFAGSPGENVQVVLKYLKMC